MPKMDYFALINQAKAEKAALVDQADQMIADKKFGTDLETIQNKIKDKAAEIDQITNQAAISAAGADPVENPDGVQDDKDGGKEKPLKVFNSLGEQLQAIRNAAKGEVDERLIRVNNAIMGTNTETGADGGYAIQEDFAGNILESAAQTGEILSRVDTYTCSANSNSVRWMTAKEEDISDSVFGGVKMFWAEEGETVEATKPQFREARLELEKMMGFAYATEELLQDAAFMSSLFGRAFMIGARRLLEGAIISGDGEKKPLGMLNSTATIEVAKAADQGAGTITADNIFSMWQRTLHEYR
ncbi:MAG: phage major capsid protein, partial [Clostridia bacterium]|nr:phage major capsid protein [Clostridia bacterium]